MPVDDLHKNGTSLCFWVCFKIYVYYWKNCLKAFRNLRTNGKNFRSQVVKFLPVLPNLFRNKEKDFRRQAFSEIQQLYEKLLLEDEYRFKVIQKLFFNLKKRHKGIYGPRYIHFHRLKFHKRLLDERDKKLANLMKFVKLRQDRDITYSYNQIISFLLSKTTEVSKPKDLSKSHPVLYQRLTRNALRFIFSTKLRF